MQRVGVVQQRFLDADTERREHEAALEPLRVHQLQARFRLAVRGVDRFEVTERVTDRVAGALAAEVLVEHTGPCDRVEGGIRDEAEHLVVDDHARLAVDRRPRHQAGAVGRQVPRERVGRLVVVVVGVEGVEVDRCHGGPPVERAWREGRTCSSARYQCARNSGHDALVDATRAHGHRTAADAAAAGRPQRPLVPVARRHVAVHARRPARRRARRIHRAGLRRRRVVRRGRAGLLDDAGLRPADLHERDHAVRRVPAERSRAEPDWLLPHHLRRPGRVDRPARRVAHGRRRQRAAAVGQRHRGRHQQGLAPRSRVRHHRARPLRRAEPARRAGRAVVRCVVRRGPGPVVARGPPPRGLPLQHAAHVPERRARDRVAHARPRHRHARPARQRAVRRSRSAPTVGSSRRGAKPLADAPSPHPSSAARCRAHAPHIASAAIPCACTRRSPTSCRGRPRSPTATSCRSRCSIPKATCTTPRRSRSVSGAVEIKGRDFLVNGEADPAARRQSSRLRSRHRPRRHASTRCATTSC